MTVFKQSDILEEEPTSTLSTSRIFLQILKDGPSDIKYTNIFMEILHHVHVDN